MSGSSSNVPSGVFGGADSSCATLAFDTQLSSPKADVIAGISVNDELAVAVHPGQGTDIVVVLHKGQVAGGLASPLVQRLRECISGGTSFVAVVLAKSEGQVRVRVKAA
jgi:hypothetical protein